MATISIADNDARKQYTQAVTANSTQLTIDFPFFSLDDINVIVTNTSGVDTTLSRGTGTGTFAVTGAAVDDGFSGGEKKRNEIFQMAMLEPKLAILDETDSGLDIDALKIVANGVNKLKNKDNAILVITHYQRLLEYIVPDYVHVLFDGKIVKSGGKELALKLEEKGYDWIKEEAKNN